MTSNVRDDLMRMRDEELKKLVSLASDRKGAEAILNNFLALEKAIAAVEPPQEPMEYARYKRASDAILACLDKAGHPMPVKEMIAEILAGGFRHGDNKAEWMLGQSIRSFTNGTGRATNLIKMVNGLVGRGEWEEERFQELS